MLFGGGSLPNRGLQRYCEWAGAKSARILVITWASAYPDETFSGIRDRLSSFEPAAIEPAPKAEQLAEKKPALFAQISRSTGIFFSGGDQANLVKLLARFPDVKAAIVARSEAGAVVAGTSAGTAILSRTIISGETEEPAPYPSLYPYGVVLAEGLGLVSDAIVDQHFLQRPRLGRLLTALEQSGQRTGLGIDENSAAGFDDGQVEVLGAGYAVWVRSEKAPRRFDVRIFAEGEKFELATGSALTPPASAATDPPAGS